MASQPEPYSRAVQASGLAECPSGREDGGMEGSLLHTTQILGCALSYMLQAQALSLLSPHQDCDFPPIIAHGRHKRVQTYSLFKTEVAYECDRGYTLVGPARLSCSASHWSPEAPQCKGNSSSLGSHGYVGGNVMKGLRVKFVPCQRRYRNISSDLT